MQNFAPFYFKCYLWNMADNKIIISLRAKEMLLHALVHMDICCIKIVPLEYMEYYDISSRHTFNDALKKLISTGLFLKTATKYEYVVTTQNLKKVK